jgi:hypothetical protein
LQGPSPPRELSASADPDQFNFAILHFLGDESGRLASLPSGGQDLGPGGRAKPPSDEAARKGRRTADLTSPVGGEGERGASADNRVLSGLRIATISPRAGCGTCKKLPECTRS